MPFGRRGNLGLGFIKFDTEDFEETTVLEPEGTGRMIQAGDIALISPLSVSPDENLLEAMRDFGSRDVEILPVEVGTGDSRRLIGLLLRADVMSRYRQEMLVANEVH